MKTDSEKMKILSFNQSQRLTNRGMKDWPIEKNTKQFPSENLFMNLGSDCQLSTVDLERVQSAFERFLRVLRIALRDSH
jgi:hypothetical protein